jgi:hypothetical protein
MASFKFGREVCSAGAKPKRTPVTSAWEKTAKCGQNLYVNIDGLANVTAGMVCGSDLFTISRPLWRFI